MSNTSSDSADTLLKNEIFSKLNTKLSYEDLLMTRSGYSRLQNNKRKLNTIHILPRFQKKVFRNLQLDDSSSSIENSPCQFSHFSSSHSDANSHHQTSSHKQSKNSQALCHQTCKFEKQIESIKTPLLTQQKTFSTSPIYKGGGAENSNTQTQKVRFATQTRQRQIHIAIISNGVVEYVNVSTAELLQLVHSHNQQKEAQNLAGGSLKLRDLRKLCSYGPGIQRASIEVRRNCILVNLLKVQCIILHKKLIILIHTAVFCSTECIHICSHNDQYSSLIGKLVRISLDNVGLFEFAALESLLVDVCSYLADDLAPIVETSEKYNTMTAAKFSHSQDLQAISILKGQVDDLADAIRDIYKALQELLNNEEDLRRLELSRFWNNSEEWECPSHKPAADDVEILIECYEQEIESMLRQVTRIDETLDDVLKIINLHLASIRNTFLKTEIGLDVLGTVCSFMSSITGIFGMNLINGFEQNSRIFWFILQLMIGIFTSTMIGTILAFYRMEF